MTRFQKLSLVIGFLILVGLAAIILILLGRPPAPQPTLDTANLTET